MTEPRPNPPTISTGDERDTAGLWVFTMVCCAFLIGLIVGTLIWMPDT